MQIRKVLMVVAFALAALGCDEQRNPPPGSPDPANLMPKDPALAKLYQQTCKSCHATSIAGAPQTGNRAQWDARFDQGMATLLDRTIAGYKGMPPLGGCTDCTEDDFRALIKFMAGRK